MGRFDALAEVRAEYQPDVLPALAFFSELAYSDPTDDDKQPIPDGESVAAGDLHVVPFVHQGAHVVQGIDTQAVIFHTPEFVVVAFRGTESQVDWLTNGQFKLRAFRDHLATDGMEGHAGFMRAFLQSWPAIGTWLDDHLGDRPLWLTGHSLGGALATLGVLARMNADADLSKTALYTFGQPRVGNDHFMKALEGALPDRIHRIVHRNDLVARIPPARFGYRHVGALHHYSAPGVVEERGGEPLYLKDLLAEVRSQVTLSSILSLFWGSEETLELAKQLASGEANEAMRGALVLFMKQFPKVVSDHGMPNYQAVVGALPPEA